MASVTHLRAVVVGVEGVLVRLGNLSRLQPWEQRLGLPPRSLVADILESPSSARACLGLMQDADVWMELACLHYHLHADEAAALAADFWASMRVDSVLLDMLHSLRLRLRVAALANAWPGARDRYRRMFAVADSVDALVLSAEEGLVMPDTRIYEAVVARLEVAPAEALFVDADPDYIAGARDAGLQALPFAGYEQFGASLSRMLAADPDHMAKAARAAS